MTTRKTKLSAEEKAKKAQLRKTDEMLRPLVRAFLLLERMSEVYQDWWAICKASGALEDILDELHPDWRERRAYFHDFLGHLMAQDRIKVGYKKQAEETLQRIGVDLDCPA